MGESSKVHITKVGPSDLAEYARTPITFAVRKRFELHGPGEGQLGFILLERDLQAPYQKDYDALSGEGPTSWATRFDLSNWVFFAAFVDDRRVGGAAVAFNTPGLFMSEGRGDLAVLWDIRVAPEARGRGVGSALFRAAESCARLNATTTLKVETQNTNVPACRFYARMGCVLGSVHRFAYPLLPDEVQLLWYKDLALRAD